MSSINDFLSILAEGKKQAIESNPGKKALKQLSETLHNDNPFLQPNKSDLHGPSKPEVVGEFILEQGTFTHASELNEVVILQAKPAAEQVPFDQINRYLKRNASFQQPDPEKVDPNLQSIQGKLKFLEQAIGKIAATGPGSGEVNLAYMDFPIATVSSPSYTIRPRDYYIGVNYSGAVTITLPIGDRNGKVFIVKDESGEASKGTNRYITVVPSGNDTIDGQNKAILAYDYGSLTFVYKNNCWRVV